MTEARAIAVLWHIMHSVAHATVPVPLVLALLVLALLGTAPRAQSAPGSRAASTPARPPIDAAALRARIDAWTGHLDRAGHLSGNLLVMRGEETLYERAFGLADFEHRVANGPHTRFCVASVTKPMTQAITIRLIERRALRLQDPIGKWLPDFPRGNEITVEHLFRHRAGVPHRVTSEADEIRPLTAADVADLARRAPLHSEPGARSVYSSAGYSVLARVLELAGAKRYRDLLDEFVVEPAKLEDTSEPIPGEVLPDRARSYALTTRGVRCPPPKDTAFLVGAGSVFSTARDLARLAEAMVGGRLGPSVRASLAPGDRLAWNGSTHGYRAFVDRDPDLGVTVAFTGNLESGAVDLLHRDLPRILRGDDVPAPRPPAPVLADATPQWLAACAGRYEMRPGCTFEIRAGDGCLWAGLMELAPIAATGSDRDPAFYSLGSYGTVRFLRDDAGAVTAVEWGSPGGAETWRRVR